MESFTNYDEVTKDIPQKVHDHLKGLIKDTKAPQTEQTKMKLIEAWLLKRAIFEKMAEHENFQKVDTMQKNNQNGCIALTLSGSIISIGPLIGETREIKYTSIGMRTDVPEELHVKNGKLAEDILCEKPLHFIDGPLEKTSSIMDLAVSTETKGENEQKASLQKVNNKLRDDFIKVNKEALETKKQHNLLRYRNDFFNKWIVIQWFIMGGIKKHIFIARAKILWLELFTKAYQNLIDKIKDENKQEEIFLDFTNAKFGKFIDEYKWYESEKKDFDIGLMKALEELPEYSTYIEFRDNFISSL